MTRFLAGAAIVTVVGMPASVHADDSGDELFLHSLGEAGVEYSDPREAIEAGKAVCQSLEAGNTLNQTVRGVKNANPDLSATKAAQFVAIARAAYCADRG